MSTAIETHDHGHSKPTATVSSEKHSTSQEMWSGDHGSSVDAKDEFLLARLGKKQVFKRTFAFLSMVALTSNILITWEGVYTSVTDYVNGGSAGLIYGYIVIWIGTFATFSCIAELSSLAPTAGGQYHWVYMLAPRLSRRFLSYLTGWMNVLAWQATVASGAFLAGTMIQGLAILNYDSYNPQPWHGTLMIWGCLLLCMLTNAIGAVLLPLLEGFLFIVHVGGFIAVFVVLCVMAPRGDIHDVFTAFYNGGNWPEQGLSVMVGLVGLVFAFVGGDCRVHMSEEMKNAKLSVPRSIVASVMINGFLGICILLATLFGIGDVDAAFNTPTGYPFIEIFQQATGSNSGGSGLSSIVLIMVLAATVGFITTSSRMIFAFARDQGLPFSGFLSIITPRLDVPFNAIAVTTVIAILLALINLGSTVVLSNIFSLAVAGFYTTYFAATGLLLWRRIRGDIKEPHEVGDNDMILDIHSGQIPWGPWRIKGWLGIGVNVFAILYQIVILFFSSWPPYDQPTPAQMNHSIVVVAAVLLWSTVYYVAWGKKTYQGPTIEITVQ